MTIIDHIPSAGVLVADPPWPFRDSLPGRGRGAAKHYPLLSVEDICSFPLPPLAPSCVLFLWRVSSQVKEAYEVIDAWGFEPKTELAWIKKTSKGKLAMGMGRTLRAAHETCIVATRGKPQPLVHNILSVFEAQRGRHSEKPDAFYCIVEQLFAGPYTELFARRPRAGWTCLGNDPALRSS